jgi:N-sulfoglucosamine sulfohydrolase
MLGQQQEMACRFQAFSIIAVATGDVAAVKSYAKRCRIPPRQERGTPYSLRKQMIRTVAWWMAVTMGIFAELPTANAQSDRPRRPNILLAIADDWGYGHAGAYGCRWTKTPGFDRVAREGLLFTRAYTPNAKCAPSRACLLTGCNSWQLEAACNHICFFPAKFKTYAEALAEHGYFVGKTTKGWGPGVANDEAGQPRAMAGQGFERRKAEPPTTGISNSDYAANFADFLDAAPAGSPWCFWYGGLEPHRGYEFGSGAAKGGKQLVDIERVPGYWSDNETVRHDLLDYGFEIEHFDRHLLKMLTLLEERGQLDSTLVVVTSDHGMPFPRAKGNAYEASNHVPLAIRWPGRIARPGRTVPEYVSFVDLAPTFVEAAGLTWNQTGLAPATGRSLSDLFRGEPGQSPPRDHVLIGQERHDIGRPQDVGFPIRGIVKDNMLYLHNYEPTRWPACNPETGYLNCDGSPTKTVVLAGRTESDAGRRLWQLCFGKRPAEELYDLLRDPDCLRNLATDSERQSLKQQLHAQLVQELQAQDDPRMSGRGSVFEEYPYADPGLRGFYERFLKGEKLAVGWVNPSDFAPAPLDAAAPAK